MTDFPDLSKAKQIAFDTETTGLNYPIDRVFGFSVAVDGFSNYYDIRQRPESIAWINDQFKHADARIICHNASFDYKMALASGINIPLQNLDDTVIRASLINEHERSYSLDSLSVKYLQKAKESDIYEELADIFGGRATRNVQMKNLYRADPSIVSPYAIVDAELVLELWKWQEEETQKQDLQKIIEFERSVMSHVIKSEVTGVRIDLDAADRAIHQLTDVIDSDYASLRKMVGFDVNVNSPKDIRKIFEPKLIDGHFIANNGYPLQMTDSGNPSIDAEALMSMKGDAVAQLILSIRSTIKTKDTFIKGHLINRAVNGIVYPNINQTKMDDGSGTGTGRLSYTKPALQQIPSRNRKVAAIVKPLFLPDEDENWGSLDMNSFEVRVFAHLINDPKINAKYRSDPMSDFHQMVADLTGVVRNATYSGQPNAKQINLSLIFNSGNGTIAEKMGMPWEWSSFEDAAGKLVTYKKAGPQAQKVIDKYHTMLPGVKKLAAKARRIAEDYGYVQTKMGRRIRFPNKYKSYKASGLAIQSTAADINKLMWKLIGETPNIRLILNTHDSYEISKPRSMSIEMIRDDLQNRLRDNLDWFRIPLIIDINGEGDNWWDAIK